MEWHLCNFSAGWLMDWHRWQFLVFPQTLDSPLSLLSASAVDTCRNEYASRSAQGSYDSAQLGICTGLTVLWSSSYIASGQNNLIQNSETSRISLKTKTIWAPNFITTRHEILLQQRFPNSITRNHGVLWKALDGSGSLITNNRRDLKG